MNELYTNLKIAFWFPCVDLTLKYEPLMLHSRHDPIQIAMTFEFLMST